MPLLKLVILFIIGIVFGSYIEDNATVLIFFAVTAFSLWLLLCVIRMNSGILKSFTNYFLVILILCMGVCHYCLNNELLYSNHFSHYLDDGKKLKTEIYGLNEKDKVFQVSVRVIELSDGLKSQKSFGKLLCSIKKPLKDSLNIGDTLMIEARVSALEYKKYYNRFNYSRYLFFKGIQHSCYIDSSDWSLIKAENSYLINRVIYGARIYVNKIIETCFKADQTKAILKAISIGDKSGLDIDLRQAFINTGAIHVLAISGLHVGILSGLFLLWINTVPKTKIILRAIIIALALLFIWLFVLISGASPSVCRAATMFSLFILSKISSKQTNSYNIIACAALFALLWNPYVLFQLSFQLSFLAIISIVHFYPKLNVLFHVQSRALKYILGLILVSLAAQVLIVPISIYYFNQISLISSISSLIAIPAISLSLLGLLLTFLVSLFSIEMAMLCSGLIEQIIEQLISGIYFMNNWSWSHLGNIYLESFQVLALYGIIISVMLYAYNRKLAVYLFLLMTIIYKSYGIYKSAYMENTLNICKYDTRNGAFIDIFFANNCLSIQKPKLNAKTIDYHANENRLRHLIKNDSQLHDITSSNRLTLIKNANYSILILNEFDLSVPIDVDYLLLTGGSSITEEARRLSKVKQII